MNMMEAKEKLFYTAIYAITFNDYVGCTHLFGTLICCSFSLAIFEFKKGGRAQRLKRRKLRMILDLIVEILMTGSASLIDCKSRPPDC